MRFTMRDANFGDVEGITAIYNDVVTNTAAIWNDAVVNTADRTNWLADRLDSGYPVLVAVDDIGTVLGYATFGDWRAWDGYRHTVEHSIHIRRENRGAGLGTTLMRELIERAKKLNKHVMIAAIEAENEVSIHLHKKLGFIDAGRMKEVGTKFGKWLDLALLQLQLDSRIDPDGNGIR